MMGKKWHMRRYIKLERELRDFIKTAAKEENGGHSINIYDPHKAACGICKHLKDVQRFANFLNSEITRKFFK